MKRKKFIPLAITMLLAVPTFLTSCQEDAPEINYTMSVSVINDFTKVVEAIDRGALKNEEAIAKLADAIDRMSSDQQAKLQAIRDVLVSVNTTLETKLAARSLLTLSPAAIMSRVKVPHLSLASISASLPRLRLSPGSKAGNGAGCTKEYLRESR